MYDKENSTIDDTDYTPPEPLEFRDLKPNNSTSKPLSAKNSAKYQTERILDATLDTLAKENAALIEENHILRNHLLLVKENAALRVANVIGELLKWFNAQCKGKHFLLFRWMTLHITFFLTTAHRICSLNYV